MAVVAASRSLEPSTTFHSSALRSSGDPRLRCSCPRQCSRWRSGTPPLPGTSWPLVPVLWGWAASSRCCHSNARRAALRSTRAACRLNRPSRAVPSLRQQRPVALPDDRARIDGRTYHPEKHHVSRAGGIGDRLQRPPRAVPSLRDGYREHVGARAPVIGADGQAVSGARAGDALKTAVADPLRIRGGRDPPCRAVPSLRQSGKRLALVTYRPTAKQSLAVGRATPVSSLRVAPAGTGVG